MGTQKNRPNETVLLSTKTYDKTYGFENIYNCTLKKLLIFRPMLQPCSCCRVAVCVVYLFGWSVVYDCGIFLTIRERAFVVL